ncbi:unnamed protein product, partial [Didymodactylos carnosus]
DLAGTSSTQPRDQREPAASGASRDQHTPQPSFQHSNERSSLAYVHQETDMMEELLKQKGDNSTLSAILGCIYGQCLGDAYGLATEFESKESVARMYPRQTAIPFPNYVRTANSSNWRKGDWSDDSDQMILIMETLIEKHSADELTFARKLSKWIRQGFPDLGDKGGTGLGHNVRLVSLHNDFLLDPHKASREVWESTNKQVAPNGAVMRCSVLGIYEYQETDRVIENTAKIAKVTHFDPRCVASCVAVNLCIAYILQKKFDVTTVDGVEALINAVKEKTLESVQMPGGHIQEFKFYT